MVLTRRGILSTSVLCIVGVITLPVLLNVISNDLYNILHSWLSLRMRLLIVTMMIILCVFALIMEAIYHKDRRLFLRLFKDTRLLLPLLKGRSYLKVWEPPDSQVTQCTSSGFHRAYDPLRNDPDALIIRNMLDSCREEGSRIQSLVRIHMALKVHTEQHVPDVEAALQSEYTTKSSKVLHRRFEIGPQTGNVDLDVLSLQIAEAMRLAREIDKNCTLQFGSFAFLKYTDGELKWWRLHEHWTPVIHDIRRSPCNIFTGERSKWIIRGLNLQEAKLQASTSDEKEEITIVHRRKMENGEDELLCAEPGLIWRSALMFWRGVYIAAWNSVSKENEALAFDLQSESRNVTRAYWISVAKGFTPNPRTMMLIIANLFVLGTLGLVTHGTLSGMGCQLGSCYLNITVYGPNFKILSKFLSMFQVLFLFIEFIILAFWWFTAKLSPSSGCPLPQQAGSPDSQHGRSPDLLSRVDCVVGEIDKARDEIRAQEECALGRCCGASVRSINPLVIARSSERPAQPSHHDGSLTVCTEDPLSDLEAACLHPLEDKSATGVAETTVVADSDDNLSVSATPSAVIEFESNGKRESIGEPGVPSLRTTAATDDLSTTEALNANSNPTSEFAREEEVIEMNVDSEKKEEDISNSITGPSSLDSGKVGPQATSIDAEKTERGESKDVIDVFQFSYTGSASVGGRERLEEQPGTPHLEIELEDEELEEKQYCISSPPGRRSELDVAWGAKLDKFWAGKVDLVPGDKFSLVREDQLFRGLSAKEKTKEKKDEKKNEPIVMRVSICCSSCEDLLKGEFRKVTGIKQAEYDIFQEKVTVTGTASLADVLSAARRHFKDAKLWDAKLKADKNIFNVRDH